MMELVDQYIKAIILYYSKLSQSQRKYLAYLSKNMKDVKKTQTELQEMKTTKPGIKKQISGVNIRLECRRRNQWT